MSHSIIPNTSRRQSQMKNRKLADVNTKLSVISNTLALLTINCFAINEPEKRFKEAQKKLNVT